MKIGEEHQSISELKRNLIDCPGRNDQAKKFGFGAFDLKRLPPCKNQWQKRRIAQYQPKKQLDLELLVLLNSDGES